MPNELVKGYRWPLVLDSFVKICYGSRHVTLIRRYLFHIPQQFQISLRRSSYGC